ncbi:MAG: DUF5067 domain-containing protein [Propionibacteriaceae bacterium]|jgi:hypothetical protein|nr:DUF5067 domain-containing protein [Propionibacteriaceae bacterium]
MIDIEAYDWRIVFVSAEVVVDGGDLVLVSYFDATTTCVGAGSLSPGFDWLWTASQDGVDLEKPLITSDLWDRWFAALDEVPCGDTFRVTLPAVLMDVTTDVKLSVKSMSWGGRSTVEDSMTVTLHLV